ncbi:Golgin subfamily B member 1 [Lemmus lemmus]
MELNNSMQDDVLERLADAEKLVVELKDVIRQKDAQLQQKDEALQEEHKAADNKIKKKKTNENFMQNESHFFFALFKN